MSATNSSLSIGEAYWCCVILYKIGVENPNGDQSDKDETAIFNYLRIIKISCWKSITIVLLRKFKTKMKKAKIIEKPRTSRGMYQRYLTGCRNNDTNLGFFGMNEMTSFESQSKQMVANGGTGTVCLQSITTRSSQNNGCTRQLKIVSWQSI